MNRQDAKGAKILEPDQRVDGVARSVLDAAFQVHTALGPGFLESVYDEALAIELRFRGIPLHRQLGIDIEYRALPVGQGRVDFWVADVLVVEVKPVEALAPIHVAQVISYLKTTGRTLGLLINFNVTHWKSGVRRIVRSV